MSWPKRCLSARDLAGGEGPVDLPLAPRPRHAEQQEFADPGGEVRLDLAQQRVAGVLVHAGQPGYRLRSGTALGDEQRLDQLLEPDVDLAREGADVLVLAQAAQIQGTHVGITP